MSTPSGYVIKFKAVMANGDVINHIFDNKSLALRFIDKHSSQIHTYRMRTIPYKASMNATREVL